ncbi:MAG: hypothetical protein EAX81_06795 [Candidatus Thorarchaeota archaeon]|nr:hypothetical protein [Candidatus Thorarchaeota archaeon]
MYKPAHKKGAITAMNSIFVFSLLFCPNSLLVLLVQSGGPIADSKLYLEIPKQKEQMTRMVVASFVVGFLLMCVGLVLPYLWNPSESHIIDPGPTLLQLIPDGLVFAGLNILIISGIFFLRDIIRSNKEETGLFPII